MASVLVDSSYLIALHYRKDKYHRAAIGFAQLERDERLIPDVVLPEVNHILLDYAGHRAVKRFIKAVVDSPAQLIGAISASFDRSIPPILNCYRRMKKTVMNETPSKHHPIPKIINAG